MIEILREDIRNSDNDLKEDMGAGFAQVNDHLANLNGKTATHGDRITTLEASRGRVDIGLLVAVLAAILSALTYVF